MQRRPLEQREGDPFEQAGLVHEYPMRATVQRQEVGGRPVCDLAVYAVREGECRHVEAEAFEVPNVLRLSRLAPRREELLAKFNEGRVVLGTSDHVKVDV